MRVKGATPYLTALGGGKNLLFVKAGTEAGPHGWGRRRISAPVVTPA